MNKMKRPVLAWSAVCYVSVISLAAVCVPASAGAATPEPRAAAGNPGAESILFEEIPSVFAASKYEQKASEAPATVSIVTAEEIEKYGYRTLGEVLESVRGFFLTYDRNYTYVAPRGFGRLGDYNTRVLLLIDGHRVNENVYDGGYFATEAVLDVDLIDRVEIIRGPSSSLYGTNAFIGVINMITKSGRDLKGGEIVGGGASFQTFNGRLSYGNRLQSGPEMLLSGTMSQSDGQDLYYPDLASPPTTDGWTSGTDGDEYRNSFGKVAWGNFVLEGAHNVREKIVPTGAWGTNFDDPDTRTTDERGFLSFRYDAPLGPQSRFSGEASYDYYRYDGNYAYPGYIFSDYGYGRWWTVNGQYTSKLSRSHRLVAGTEYRINTQQDQGAEDGLGYEFEDRRTSDIWALYVQDEFRMGGKAILYAGLRHDGYDTFGGTTNPRIALILTPAETTSVKFMYGSAFRAPNIYELYYNDGGATQKDNPGLEPETIATYEAAVEHVFRSGLRAVATVYRYDVEDLISLTTDPLDLLLVFQNLDEVKTDGFELEMEGRFGRFLDGRFSYAYQDAEDVSTGKTPPNSPKHLAKLNLSFPISKKGYFAGLETQYVGPRLTLGGDELGGYALVNLNLLSRAWRNLVVSAGAYNLFDRAYADPGGAEHTQDDIPQDGRTYRLRVRVQF